MRNVVKKKSSQASLADLVVATRQFAELVDGQGEGEAASDLRKMAGQLEDIREVDSSLVPILLNLVDAFEGDHELGAYTLASGKKGEWTDSDDLYVASTRVLSLTRRLQKALER